MDNTAQYSAAGGCEEESKEKRNLRKQALGQHRAIDWGSKQPGKHPSRWLGATNRDMTKLKPLRCGKTGLFSELGRAFLCCLSIWATKPLNMPQPLAQLKN
jgi:hypothetical protein